MLVLCFIAVVCLISTGCISFEEEVFLNQDGSGEFVLQLSMPDLPDSVTKSSPAGGMAKSPQEQVAEMKKQLTAGLKPGVTLEEVKEVRENGSLGFYAIFKFKDVRDIAPALEALGKSNDKKGSLADNSKWSIDLKKVGGKNQFSSSVFYDIKDDKANPSDKPSPTADSDNGGAQANKNGDFGADLDRQLKPLIMGMIRMRFVLHTPSRISDSNADIVLHGNTAIWNSSMIAFINNKKPIEMRATY